MKKLSLVLHAELEIPDDWELVEHPAGIYVLKVGDRFVDFDITPLATTSDEPDASWSDEDEQFTDEILDMVTGLDSKMEISGLFSGRSGRSPISSMVTVIECGSSS